MYVTGGHFFLRSVSRLTVTRAALAHVLSTAVHVSRSTQKATKAKAPLTTMKQ